MCNEYRFKQSLDRIAQAFSELRLPLHWLGGAPNLEPRDSIRPTDPAPIVVGTPEGAELKQLRWGRQQPGRPPVINFRSEGRDFSRSDRVLVLADGFIEYTAPAAPVKLKDRHLFTKAGEPWFWIAGIVQEGCFSLLTTAPGSDVAPYHDRQIVTLAPDQGMAWLNLSQPEQVILRAPPAGAFQVRTLRKDGVVQAA